ncbi:peptide transporter family 1 isoform X1 [Leguminivora glycinivorella]|uniref:peptide transporter family 1 isoform X1 n=1 Tax=Leguminivora glycinivorella TaxID=1035111 RepID=UPI00200BD7AD|nr:peptide transporter family 1 isoform X1 [Leguminivora glycinivorella]
MQSQEDAELVVDLLGKGTKKLPYPTAVGFIVTNELCERFSFYGMKAILSLYLRDKLGYSDDGATIIYHVFTMFAYFFPLLGAMIADGWLGRFRTILYLSMVYAFGSILISVTAMPPVKIPQLEFSILALLLIAFGTGGIKPCVSAFGGDQFKLPEQEKYLGYFFSLFYAAINAGSLVSTFLTPILRADVHCFGDNDCYSLAFGVPGVLMVISIVIFVAGRRRYIVKNPAGNIIGQVGACIGHGIVKSAKSKEKREHWLDHAQEKFGPALVEDVKGLLRVLVLFTPVPIFWALFDQQGSRWTFQADRMRQDIGNWELKADQMQVLNPLLILIFIPIFQVAIYPFMTWCKLISKPLHKMIWGGLLAAAAFVISGIVELSLLPTYGTPIAAGLAQLRVYNGFNCNLTLSVLHENNLGEFHVPPLSVYEKLNIKTDNFIDLPYSLQGNPNTECAGVHYNGTFSLEQKTAKSFFVSSEGVYNFTDDNEKVIGGVGVRFLSNIRSISEISIVDVKKNKTKLSLKSNYKDKKVIERGSYDVVVGGQTVLTDYSFQTGGVYTINVYEDSNGNYVADGVTITPPNGVHILWLIPQYVVITMAEVMFSVTGLEFSFTQAPASMKSVLQAVWLLTVAIGNLIVVLIVEGNFLDAQWKEFFLFAGLMVLDILIFMAMAFRYRYVELRSSAENLAVEEIKMPPRTDGNKDTKQN